MTVMHMHNKTLMKYNLENVKFQATSARHGQKLEEGSSYASGWKLSLSQQWEI